MAAAYQFYLVTDHPFIDGNKGLRGNNFTFFAEDFRCLPRNADEAISGIFRGGVTKAGGEKTGKECEVISALTLRKGDGTHVS